jgi:hypothetical protein
LSSDFEINLSDGPSVQKKKVPEKNMRSYRKSGAEFKLLIELVFLSYH